MKKISLTIYDDEVYEKLKEIAKEEHSTITRVINELLLLWNDFEMICTLKGDEKYDN